MLSPKKVKYRKQQKGRMRGKAYRGSLLSFGAFGLQAIECGRRPKERHRVQDDKATVQEGEGDVEGGENW